MQGAGKRQQPDCRLDPRLQNLWAKERRHTVIAQRRICSGGLIRLIKMLGNIKDQPTRSPYGMPWARLPTRLLINDLIEKMRGCPPEELRSAEPAIVETARRDPDAAHRGQDVLQAYRANSGNDDEQAAPACALCRIGNKVALPTSSRGSLTRTPRSVSTPPWAWRNGPTRNRCPRWWECSPRKRRRHPPQRDQYHRRSGDHCRAICRRRRLPVRSLPLSTPPPRSRARSNRSSMRWVAWLISVAAFFTELSGKDAKRKAQVQGPLKAGQRCPVKVVPVGETATPLPVTQAFLTPGPLLFSAGTSSSSTGLG